jgi:hypothetical protein
MIRASGIRVLPSVAGICVCAALLAATASADAAVKISDGATQNMSCSGGVCSPTAKSAVLNAGDLEALLASGNTTVTTTGKSVEANNLTVSAALSWSSANTLSLQAHKELKIDKAVSVAGSGGLSLSANSKGGAGADFSFGPHGNASFASQSGKLSIEGAPYTLVNTIAQLAQDIGSNPAGSYALAASYNAKHDGTYTTSPISTTFNGIFEGLGNSISNLTINDTNTSDLYVGLFAQLVTSGQSIAQIRDIGIVEASVSAVGGNIGDHIGSLLGFNEGGVIRGSFSTGTIGGTGLAGGVGGLIGAVWNNSAGNAGQLIASHSVASVAGNETSSAITGGLVGSSGGVLRDCYATGPVDAPNAGISGGLVGLDTGQIRESFASGPVSGVLAGGLVGLFSYSGRHHIGKRLIVNSYATGAVTASGAGAAGGLIGESQAGVTDSSYSTGAVTGGSYVGGLVGYDFESSTYNSAYWDTNMSGITNLSQGVGNISNYPGIAGLSTQQLQAGLPDGFDPKVWAEDPNTNNGLPYLIDNPPPQ